MEGLDGVPEVGCKPFDPEHYKSLYNATSGKFVLQAIAPCDGSWSVKEDQCNLEGTGVCLDGECWCPPGEYMIIRRRPLPSTGVFLDYTCHPQLVVLLTRIDSSVDSESESRF